MKLKAPIPQIQEIEGEKFEETPRLSAAEIIGPRPSGARSYHETHEASERCKALYAKGFGKRSVVCVKSQDKFEPINWGVIVEVHPFSSLPLEVRLVNGKGIIRSNGTDIDIIYRAMSKSDMQAWFAAQTRGLV